ncbi:hypothetical protein BS78_03G405000 [Paspalum vaginatum]|nr:hypothetical protein BS78_03G405000 [Paspalum vaginatum]
MSRHRRQPSRALPLDFSVVDDGEGPAAAKGCGAITSLDGGSLQDPRAGGSGGAGRGRGDAGNKGHEGQTTKKPPPATGSRAPSDGIAKKSRDDDGAGGR